MFIGYTYVSLNALRYAVGLLESREATVREDVLGFLAAHEDDDSNCMLQIGPYSIAMAANPPRATE